MSIHSGAAPQRILLVDDDPHLLALLASILRSAHYQPVLATSASMALSILQEGSAVADLAILDIHMPEVSGLQLTERLRHVAPLPFLMMSASHGVSFVERAASQGAAGFLVKPIQPAHLIAAVISGLALGREILALQRRQASLTAALQASRTRAMAVGVLMERFRLGPAAALSSLEASALASGRGLDVCADELISSIGRNDAAGSAMHVLDCPGTSATHQRCA